MAKRSAKPINREKLVDDLYKAVQAYIEGFGGKLSIVGPMEIVAHKPMSFHLVIHCVGQRPKLENDNTSVS